MISRSIFGDIFREILGSQSTTATSDGTSGTIYGGGGGWSTSIGINQDITNLWRRINADVTTVTTGTGTSQSIFQTLQDYENTKPYTQIPPEVIKAEANRVADVFMGLEALRRAADYSRGKKPNYVFGFRPDRVDLQVVIYEDGLNILIFGATVSTACDLSTLKYVLEGVQGRILALMDRVDEIDLVGGYIEGV